MENQNKQTAITGYLEKLTPAQLVADPKVSKKFVQLYNSIHGNAMGEAIYNKEQFNFIKLVNDNAELKQCSKLSLYGAFLDIAINGLSLDNTSKPLCYLMSRNAKSKDAQGRDIWEKRAYIKVSPNGEIYYRKRSGQIKNADNPQIVWEGDTIRVGLNAFGKHIVKEHERLIPRKANAKILGGYIRIERHDGSYECLWMDISETERLREYSNRNNKGTSEDDKSNKLYTSFNGQIDPGFFEAKITRHAFDSYPPIKIGAHTELASKDEPEPAISYDMTVTEETNVEDVTNKEETGAFGTQSEPETYGTTGTIIEDETGAF